MRPFHITTLFIVTLAVILFTLGEVLEERSRPHAKRTAGLLTGFTGLCMAYIIGSAAVYLAVHS